MNPLQNKTEKKRYNIKIYDDNTKSNCNLDSWKIKLNYYYLQYLDKFIEDTNIDNGTYLLDTTKDNFEMIEKIVYDLTCFHLDRLNLLKDFNRYKIEFWWKNDKIIKDNNIIHELHSDKDEILMRSKNILLSPLLSTVTYINDSEYPTIITSTPENLIKNNNTVNLQNGINICFAKKLNHISFNGNNLHGVFNTFNNLSSNENRKTLMFNIWDTHTPLSRNIYKNNNKIYYTFCKKYKILKIKNTKTKYISNIGIDKDKMKEYIDIILNNPNKINTIFDIYIDNILINNSNYNKFISLFSNLYNKNKDIIKFDII
jgi:hypothetical protein